MLGVSHVVTTSVGMCDIDIRPVSASLLFDGIKVSFSTVECSKTIFKLKLAGLGIDFEVPFVTECVKR